MPSASGHDRDLNLGYSLEEQLADAIFLDDIEDVQTLLTQTLDLDLRDDDLRTPLLAAVENGNATIVRLLLDAGADPDVADGDGFTPLHVAALRRRLDLVWLLVRAGADVNAADADGNSVLAKALLACGTKLEVVALLRRSGACDDQRNRAGLAPADVAARTHISLPTAALMAPS